MVSGSPLPACIRKYSLFSVKYKLNDYLRPADSHASLQFMYVGYLSNVSVAQTTSIGQMTTLSLPHSRLAIIFCVILR